MAASFVKAAEAGGFDFGSASDTDAKLAALGFCREKYRCVAMGGNAIVRPSWGAIDLSQVGCDGVMLPSSSVEGFGASSFGEVRACFVVENLTNFRVLCTDAPKGLLAVWGHGKPNEAVRRLVEILDDALLEGVPFLAWSDIDSGGFDIVETLMSASGRIRPFMMGGRRSCAPSTSQAC